MLAFFCTQVIELQKKMLPACDFVFFEDSNVMITKSNKYLLYRKS
jgi:hypothetical protein